MPAFLSSSHSGWDRQDEQRVAFGQLRAEHVAARCDDGKVDAARRSTATASEALEDRRAGGVGDVAGERGDRACGVDGACNRGISDGRSRGRSIPAIECGSASRSRVRRAAASIAAARTSELFFRAWPTPWSDWRLRRSRRSRDAGGGTVLRVSTQWRIGRRPAAANVEHAPLLRSVHRCGDGQTMRMRGLSATAPRPSKPWGWRSSAAARSRQILLAGR